MLLFFERERVRADRLVDRGDALPERVFFAVLDDGIAVDEAPPTPAVRAFWTDVAFIESFGHGPSFSDVRPCDDVNTITGLLFAAQLGPKRPRQLGEKLHLNRLGVDGLQDQRQWLLPSFWTRIPNRIADGLGCVLERVGKAMWRRIEVLRSDVEAPRPAPRLRRHDIDIQHPVEGVMGRRDGD